MAVQYMSRSKLRRRDYLTIILCDHYFDEQYMNRQIKNGLVIKLNIYLTDLMMVAQ